MKNRYCEECKMNINNSRTSCHHCGRLIVNPILSEELRPSLTEERQAYDDVKSYLMTVRSFVLMVGSRHPELLRSENRTQLIDMVKTMQPEFKERTIDREARHVRPLVEKYFPQYFVDDAKINMMAVHTEFYSEESDMI